MEVKEVSGSTYTFRLPSDLKERVRRNASDFGLSTAECVISGTIKEFLYLYHRLIEQLQAQLDATVPGKQADKLQAGIDQAREDQEFYRLALAAHEMNVPKYRMDESAASYADFMRENVGA